MMQDMTTLGMSERLERVLAYAFGWVSGIILFMVEKNRNVRWHAAQSMVTFGTLSFDFVRSVDVTGNAALDSPARLAKRFWAGAAAERIMVADGHSVGLAAGHGLDAP